MKVCKRCNRSKPLSEYYTFVRKDRPGLGVRPKCKDCEAICRAERTKKDRINANLRRLVHSIKVGSRLVKEASTVSGDSLRGTDNLLGKTDKELRQMLEDNFLKDIAGILDEGKIPTVELIDATGSDELCTIRIVAQEHDVEHEHSNSRVSKSIPIEVTLRLQEPRVYTSITEASKQTGVSRSTLSRWLEGKPSYLGTARYVDH